MPLTPSLEDYLEAVFVISRTKKTVRVKDVAAHLGVTMPSVNNAMKTLESKGLIIHEKYEYIELTKSGATQASRVESRHRLLFTFLRDHLGVDEQTADDDACRMEHVMSAKTLEKMSEFITKNPVSRP